MIEGIYNLDEPRERVNLSKAVLGLRRMHSVRIAEYHERRSGQANRFLWGVVYAAFVRFRNEQGEDFTSDQAHEFFGMKFLRQPVINMDTGETLGQTRRSTKDLDTKEFSEYVEKCIAWMADYGIEVSEAVPAAMRKGTAA